jgi:sulfide:quinone oxidoreductase
MGPGFRRVAVDRVVSLPRLVGPSLPGLPVHHDGFVPTDEYGQVTGLHDVYAAGDMTVFPVKQGGIAAQQAEVVARAIAAAAGAPVEPTPFRPVLWGMLLVDRGKRRFLRHRLAGGNTDAQAADHALWWPPTKVASRYLAPYLFDRDQAAALHAPPAPHIAVELPLDPPVVHGAPGAPGLELLGEPATGAAQRCP